MFDSVGVGLLVLFLVVFAFLTVRALRARRRWVKIVGGIPAALITVVFAAGVVLALVGYGKLNATHTNPVRDVKVAGTPEQLVKGEKFARSCAGCHSPNGQLPLTGKNFLEGAPFGTFYAPNLTQAHFSEWSDGEIIRAIREGVSKNGRSLLIMPSGAFHKMSDDDVEAIVAYLRSQPTDAPNTPPNSLNVLGAIMFGNFANVQTAQEPVAGPVSAPPAGPTEEYGGYLVGVSGCQECHGTTLDGGVSPDSGAITPSLLATVGKTWTEEDFIKMFRTGITPDGRTLDPAQMPWTDFEKYSDDDLRAIYRYIKAKA